MSTENEMRDEALLDLLRDYEDKPESMYGILDRAYAAGRRAGAERMLPALREALIPLAALVVSGECTTAPSALTEELKQAIVKAHDSVLNALARALPREEEHD